jgi:hypothetical protein
VLDEHLAPVRLQPGRVLQLEPAPHQALGLGQPPVGRLADGRAVVRLPGGGSSVVKRSATSGRAVITSCSAGASRERAWPRVRRSAGTSKSCSSARCTTVPRTAAEDGTCGSRST